MPQRKPSLNAPRSTRNRNLSLARIYSYLPWAFVSLLFYGIKQKHHTLGDLKVLAFTVVMPLFVVLGFRGEISSPFGRVVVTNREKMKSVAYGAFKTYICYLRNFETLLDRQSLFPVVVDVGANVGDFSLAMASRVTKVVAIEPGADNFATLMLNISANNAKNILPLNVAAHSQDEFVPMGGTGSALHVVGNGEQSVRGVRL